MGLVETKGKPELLFSNESLKSKINSAKSIPLKSGKSLMRVSK
jgi:hypothetical protein